MQTVKLKITALTPLHLGTGEDYDPTNFVVDGGYLYEFNEVDFYNRLDKKQKEEFIKAVESKSNESLFAVHRVIKQNKKVAIEASFNRVQVPKSIEKAYEHKIGRAVQIEGGRRRPHIKVFNLFLIAKTSRLKNSRRVYIPGSSLKGAISTALQEHIFKKNPKLYKRLFEDVFAGESFMKELSVADTIPQKTYAIIGYALNKERFEDDELGPNTILEVIYSSEKQQSVFEATLTFKERFNSLPYQTNIEEIKKASNEHYLPIFRQMFKAYAQFKGKSVDDYTNEYFSDGFYNKYKDLKLKENQFLLRVGKYSQARAVTIDGKRKIRVKISGGGPRRKPNRWETLDQETTTWMFGFNDRANSNLMPFGWVLCEIIEQSKDSL